MATLTITLPDDLAEAIRTLVASGDYPDESAVLADLLRDRIEPLEVTAAWMADVAEIVDRIDAGTEPLYTADAVMAHLDEARRQRQG